jgi:hypothetical protein
MRPTNEIVFHLREIVCAEESVMKLLDEAAERLQEYQTALFFQRGEVIGNANFITKQLRLFGDLPEGVLSLDKTE